MSGTAEAALLAGVTGIPLCFSSWALSLTFDPFSGFGH